jgi:hypothetical protein
VLPGTGSSFLLGGIMTKKVSVLPLRCKRLEVQGGQGKRKKEKRGALVQGYFISCSLKG